MPDVGAAEEGSTVGAWSCEDWLCDDDGSIVDGSIDPSLDDEPSEEDEEESPYGSRLLESPPVDADDPVDAGMTVVGAATLPCDEAEVDSMAKVSATTDSNAATSVVFRVRDEVVMARVVPGH